jgi:peptidoglycan lytic transglycosylase
MAGSGVDRAGVASVAVGAALMLFLGGCSLPPVASWHPAAGPSGPYVEVGTASWYGPGFVGNRTSSGEVYTARDMTAAHQTLPLGTRVMVTNLENGRSVEVRINDRGPFVKGRVIDLSHAAARELALIGPGTTEVRIESLDDGQDPPAAVAYAVQAGAFQDGERAFALRADLAERFSKVYLSPLRTNAALYYRVRVGPFDRRDEAVVLVRRLSSDGVPATIVEEVRR